MKVSFQRLVVPKTGGGGWSVWKKVELPFAPWVGMEVEDPVLHRNAPRFTVEHVSLSLGYSDDETVVYAFLGKERLDSAEEVDECVEMYEGHGWFKPGASDPTAEQA